MADQKAYVVVVDDDLSLRDASAGLLRGMGLHVDAFDSAEAFLGDAKAASAQCLLLDIDMPNMSGLELQRRLAGRMPIIFMTAFLDDRKCGEAMRDGAVAVLEKPCEPDSLLRTLRLVLKL